MAETLTRRPIQRMSPLVASQIAAGEVVERPASVVKELVENALDAGANRISIDLEQGGIELVRVADDGGGIPAAELPLALAAHATSKITSPDDLDHIATMGFRGEALASIASVSRLTIRSRWSEQPSAAEVTVEGDTLQPTRPASGPVGTTVTVRNLFFNTPARRKFLRTPTTEQGRCADIVRQIAMSHPAIGFVLTSDGRVTLDLPTRQTPRDRCLSILGTELESELIEISSDPVSAGVLGPRANLSIWGLIGRPSLARATAAGQFIFVNARPVRDRTLQHAVKEAYRGLIEPGRYPTCVVMIDLPASAVDVNVHPAKAEVRFRDSSAIHQTLLHTIRRALQAHDLTPSVQGEWGGSRGGFGILPSTSSQASGLIEPTQPLSAPRYVNPAAFAQRFREVIHAQPQGYVSFEALREASASAGESHATNGVGGALPSPAPGSTQGVGSSDSQAVVGGVSGGAASEQLLDASPASAALQVHNSFLVTQDSSGILIIDQHALHERVMFEKLLARLNADGARLESQRMLVPVVVDASPRQLEALDSMKPLFARLGIELEAIGPTSVAIQAFSTFLFDRGVEAGPFIAEVLDRAVEQAWDTAPTQGSVAGVAGVASAPLGQEAVLHEVLDMMACKAAIKAGDKLSDLELGELLALRERIERASNCPHGRPTSIRLTIRELEKRFGRS